MSHFYASPHLTRKTRGFTLVELLIVAAVIGILAAIMFPVFAKVRETGRRTACSSNLKQIALALAYYSQDNSGKYPGEPYNDGNDKAWATVIQPYLKNVQLYQCPSEANAQISDISLDRKDYSDYFYNTNFTYIVTGLGITTRSVSQSRLKAPADTILVGEGYNGRYDYNSMKTEEWRGDTFDASSETYTPITSGPEPRKRHADGGNYAFADGHVKWFKSEGISEGCNSGWTGAPPAWCLPAVAKRPGALDGAAATFAAY